jgi:hypothetical protein
VTPLFAEMLPVTMMDPLTRTDPVISRVSALLEYNTLPVLPATVNPPETNNDPETITV